ncbi:MAG: hypothetical protein QOF35_1553 [Actinomycetota bacterium]|nr:hypothetical protein [Actinomycetota bacterium]
MSLFDRVRRVPRIRAPSDTRTDGPLRWAAAVGGAFAALLSMLLIALPALLAWVASPASTVGWPRALSVGSCVWLLANGAHLSSGPATISLTPLLLATIPLAIATKAARRILVRLDGGSPRMSRWAGVRSDVAQVGVTFAGSYAAVGLLVALATAGDPLHASLLGSFAGTALVGAASMLAALALEFRGKAASLAPDLAALLEARVPIAVRRAIGPGLWGALAIFGAGLALTLGMVVTHLGRIGRLYDTLGPDPVGLFTLSLGQVMVLPNVAVWAASWIAGPGFGLGADTAVTWSHSSPGLLPLVPGLGAVPAPGPLPAHLWLSALVPVAAGALVGWRALRLVARLSSWQAKAKTAASACGVAALALTLASTAAGGSLGASRLSGLGAPSLIFGFCVLGELLIGAAVVVLLSHLRAGRT